MDSIFLAVMVYLLVPILLPLGFVVALFSFMARFGKLRRALDPGARQFWRWNAAAHFLFAYAALVLTLLAADTLLGEPWNLPAWWPCLARIWSTAQTPRVLILLDVATALIASVGALLGACYYGRLDEEDVWHPPRRLTPRRRTPPQDGMDDEC